MLLAWKKVVRTREGKNRTEQDVTWSSKLTVMGCISIFLRPMLAIIVYTISDDQQTMKIGCRRSEKGWVDTVPSQRSSTHHFGIESAD